MFFGIQTGVAIMFLVKKENKDADCKIEYIAMEDNWRKEEKLEWLRTHKFKTFLLKKLLQIKIIIG